VPSLTQTGSRQGPVIDLQVGVTAAYAAALAGAGLPLPNFKTARMLIDTGASHTCLDPDIIAPLGIAPKGTMPIHTPSTQGTAVEVAQYDVRLVMFSPAQGPRWFDAVAVSACAFAGQGIDGLLGRDILAHCTFFYNGEADIWTLGW
jgi:hypothetical protein